VAAVPATRVGEDSVKKVVVGLVAGVALAAPGAASAAQTIGQVPDLPASYSSCTDDEAYIQLAVAAGAGSSASASGVITSWSARSNGNVGQTVKLMVFRDVGSGSFSAVAKDATTRTLSNVADQLDTFTGTHIPIEAGQSIGVYLPAGSVDSCEFNTSSGADHAGYSLPDGVGEPGEGTPFDYSIYDSAVRVNARAVVEPDADRDTFGDETQDHCVGVAGPNDGCAAATPPHKKKCKKHKRRAASASKKRCKHKKR
jgi:hypothetical protein